MTAREMTPATLAEIGEAMFGASWQRALAREIGAGERTVRAWAAGDRGIRPEVAARIVEAARARAARLAALAEEIAS